MSRAEPSRRSVLVALALAGVAACDRGEEPRPLPTRQDPDAALRRQAVRDVRRLVASHEATLLAYPVLSTPLGPMLRDHQVHLRALQAGRARSGAPPTGTPSRPEASPAPPVPPTPRAARDALARSEQDAADRRVAQLATASPGLARLLAAIGASDAAHSALLRDAT